MQIILPAQHLDRLNLKAKAKTLDSKADPTLRTADQDQDQDLNHLAMAASRVRI